MKNIILFVVFILSLVVAQFANGQSVDDIIDQYITARGGKDKLASIKSIYMEGSREMMGNEVDVKVTKVDGKLNRVDFTFGSKSGYNIITPEKGWSYIPMRSDKAEEIPQERLKTMQDQLDISGPLVDYASKGYKAVLQGKDTANGKETWKILLTSNTGKEETFFIDTASHLLVQTKQTIQGDSRRNNGAPTEVITDYSDYKDFDGVMFPQTVTTEGTGMGAGAMIFEKIVINPTVDEKMYKPSN